MPVGSAFRKQPTKVPFHAFWLGLCLALSLACHAAGEARQWTIYIAQDKHLDYGWCGSTTEIELRMAALLDYHLDAAERNEAHWNLDGTLWEEVYRRHRGQSGVTRLRNAIHEGQIGYAGNYAVLLWGILDTETAIRACYGATPIEQATGVPARTALVMENPGLTWGAANLLTECGFDFLGRGIYWLRAESYNPQRERVPLFWWKAPNGKHILVHWDLYSDTQGWGGYAEAFRLLQLAGVRPDAGRLQEADLCTDAGVFEQRKAYIEATVARYETYGDVYPISSILLLGTGHDGWICTSDIGEFIRLYNARSDGRIRLVDARYQDFFEAAEHEIRERNLHVPTLAGSFGICWEEWAAHLAGPTAQFREAQRLLRLAEASHAIETMAGRADPRRSELIRHGVRQLLKFAEHDFGGTDRQRAALSAGVRASAATQASDIARALAPRVPETVPLGAGAFEPEKTTFEWRGGRVVFDPNRCGVTSLTDADGYTWVPDNSALALGQFMHTRYRSRAKPDSVFPAALASSAPVVLQDLQARRSAQGVEIRADFHRGNFEVESRWFFHAAQPWIDITHRLRDGWSDDPQTVQFCFPLALDAPTYRYDAPGAILTAGSQQTGGDDLPGANPELFAGLTFACASGDKRTVLVLAPDTLLWQFGSDAIHTEGDSTPVPSAFLASMPMMNLTGNDWQFGQGGWRDWTFRYRVVLADGPFDPVRAVQEAQQFGTTPFLKVPGQEPTVPGLEAFDIRFPGGPLLAFKLAQDDQRLVLRFWNVSNHACDGTLRLPAGWTKAERCDALERHENPLEVADGRVRFRARPAEILTLAVSRQH